MASSLQLRAIEIAKKSWKYMLRSLESPACLHAAIKALSRRAHLGEALNVARLLPWIKAQEVKLVIDCGAHAGEFASAACTLLPWAQVYSFEPLPDVFEILKRRMRNRTNWRGFQCALSDTVGSATFYKSSFTKSSSLLPMSSLHKREFPWSANVSHTAVPTNTLDNLLRGEGLSCRSWIKIDVQGGELAVLRGAENTIQHAVLITIEVSFEKLYEGEATFHDVYDWLRSRGFEYRGAMDQLHARTDRRPLQQDAIFTRSSAR